MTALSRFGSNANFHRLDETCADVTAEEGDLPVSGRNRDRQTSVHPSNTALRNLSGDVFEAPVSLIIERSVDSC